ncbi:hypothetical protein [uncultured Selenomonas sp.]|uniref:hypothetical protein n=1 Tax=uncultured Selenomonas sp. TaxID=159275 RepID=UPI0025EC6989|nr:hypothetical protein [uncultured Selenomonas sp.]
MKKSILPAAFALAFAAMSFVPTHGAAEPQQASTQSALPDDPALAAILAKADADAAAKRAGATEQEKPSAPAIDAAAIAGDWQLMKVNDTDAPYLYVDSTLRFDENGTVTIHQRLKNRDRTDDWTATVTGAQDAGGAWQFTPANETITVRSYENRPAAKTDLEDQIAPWLFRYDEADRYKNHDTHARTIHRSYVVTSLADDTLTVALTYSDTDGCDPRTVTLTYTRGLHVVTDEDRAAQEKLDTPWKTSKEAAAEKAKAEQAAAEKAKAEQAAAEKAKAEKETAREAARESAPPERTDVEEAEAIDTKHPTVEDVHRQVEDTGDVPELRMTL